MPLIPGKLCCVFSLTSFLHCLSSWKTYQSTFSFLESSSSSLLSDCLCSFPPSSEMLLAFLSHFCTRLFIFTVTVFCSLVSFCLFNPSRSFFVDAVL